MGIRRLAEIFTHFFRPLIPAARKRKGRGLRGKGEGSRRFLLSWLRLDQVGDRIGREKEEGKKSHKKRGRTASRLSELSGAKFRSGGGKRKKKERKRGEKVPFRILLSRKMMLVFLQEKGEKRNRGCGRDFSLVLDQDADPEV